MEKNDLIEYKKKLQDISGEVNKKRDLYLRRIALGEIQGPLTGYPSIDRIHLKYYKESDIESDIPKMNLYKYLLLNNINSRNNIAINYGPISITYQELFNKIESAANSLSALGIQKGDIIASCLPNIPEALYLIYGAAKIGAIIDLIDAMSSKELLAKYCDISKPKIMFVLDAMSENAISNLGFSSYEKVITVSPTESIFESKQEFESNSENIIKWKKFINSGINIASEFCEYTENMPFALLHTGGTSGIPKGALLSHDNLISLSHQIKHSPLEMKSQEKALCLMPPFASYGLSNGIHVHLCSGMQLILIPSYDPSKIGEQIVQFKPNRIACSPAHYECIKNSPELENTDLSFLHHPIEGGDTLDIKTEIAVNDLFLRNGCRDKVGKAYGLTETSAGICYCVNNATNKLKSVGIPLVKTTIAIFDEDDINKELPYNSTGEIAISSPNNMLEYYKEPTETQEMLCRHSDGSIWLHTGDLGRIDDDGVLYVEGRKRRMIIQFSGLKSNPFEAEEQLMKHPKINRAVVIGAKDLEHNQGELPVAYILVNTEDLKNTEYLMHLKEELHQLCEKNVTYYSVPIDYVFVDEYPRTNRGKVNFLELSEQYNAISNTRPIIRQRQLKI